jgi:hypothetical protein
LAATVVRLALDAPERARLGNNARLAFEANYEKGIAVVRWIKMLDRLAAK